MNNTLCKIVLFQFFFLLFGSLQSFGQDILWLHYFNRYKLSYKFSIDSDIGYRQYFPEGNRTQIRSGLRYDINENMYVRSGLMYVNGNISREEVRPYQDFVINSRFSSFTFTQRIRLEEQFYIKNSSTTKIRLRYNPSIKFSTFFGFCTFGCEPFFVLNDSKSLVTSNRLYIGLTRKAYKNILVTVQYINERSYKKAEHSFINESNMIRIKVAHTIHPLKTGPLFEKKKINS